MYLRRSDSYNTKQKDIILETIKKKKNEFSAKEIYNDLNKEIGLTTIYRFIDKLVNDGTLNKEVGEDNTAYYQYLEECNCHNHFYLKCTECGKLIHVDCDCIEELTSHINKKHKFTPNKDHIIINGTCKECNKNEK